MNSVREKIAPKGVGNLWRSISRAYHSVGWIEDCTWTWKNRKEMRFKYSLCIWYTIEIGTYQHTGSF